MAKMKTSELSRLALAFTVARIESPRLRIEDFQPMRMDYAGDWRLAGPIIGREMFKVFRNVSGAWTAQIRHIRDDGTLSGLVIWHSGTGPTLIIAAMRCFVASVKGDEVDVPDELAELAA